MPTGAGRVVVARFHVLPVSPGQDRPAFSQVPGVTPLAMRRLRSAGSRRAIARARVHLARRPDVSRRHARGRAGHSRLHRAIGRLRTDAGRSEGDSCGTGGDAVRCATGGRSDHRQHRRPRRRFRPLLSDVFDISSRDRDATSSEICSSFRTLAAPASVGPPLAVWPPLPRARACGRLEWAVLTWTRPLSTSIDSWGRSPLTNGRSYRLDRAGIRALAGATPPCIMTDGRGPLPPTTLSTTTRRSTPRSNC